MDIVNSLLGNTVHFYFFNLIDGSGKGARAYNHTQYKKLRVVYENDRSIVLDTEDLSKIAKSGENMGTTLGRPFVHLKLADNYWGNSIDFMLYSEVLYTPDEIKDIIRTEISKQTKFLDNLDLSAFDGALLESGNE